MTVLTRPAQSIARMGRISVFPAIGTGASYVFA